MATITAVLRTSKLNKQGTAPIYIRIADRDRTVYVSTGERVKPAEWNPNKSRVRATNDYADDINDVIDAKIAEAKRHALLKKATGEVVTAEDVKEAVQPSARGRDFFSYAEHVAADHEARGSYQRAQKIRTVAGKLKGFTGQPLAFGQLTPAVLRGFETHLITKHVNSPNTVRANFNAIRAVYYRAIREGFATQGNNPFFTFKPIKGVRTERAKLTLDEIRRIEALDLPEGSLIWRTRALFLFSFYCAGIRYGDLATLTQEAIVKEQGGALRLSYRMGKTGGLQNLKLVPQARAILKAFPPREGSPFLFPILDGYDLSSPQKARAALSSRTVIANKYLGKIAEQAKINVPLTTHVARHSFADIARQSGWDVYLISRGLVHSNLKMTDNYLKGFDSKALDEKMHELFGG